MKTVLISGEAPPPAALRDIVARGSTSLAEYRAAELNKPSGIEIEADRVLFWSAADDPDVRTLAERVARDLPDGLLFVAADRAIAGSIGLAPDQFFVWPADEDRLTLVFLTAG